MSTNSNVVLPYNLMEADAELAANDIAKNWKWILAAGILNLIAGIIALLAPTMATVFVLVLISVTLLFAGGANMTGLWFAEQGMKTQSFLLGIVQCILGLLLWFYPFPSLVTITIMIAITFMLDGLFRCILALNNRSNPTLGWTLINGVCAVAFSLIILAAMPVSSLYTLSILVGANLMSLGMCRIAIAMVGRKAALEVIESQPSAGLLIA